jgi:hypothetical protein
MTRTPIKSPGPNGKAEPPNRKGTPPAAHETLGALVPATVKKVVPKKSATKAAAARPAKSRETAPEPKPEKKRSERTKALNFTVTANFRKAFKLAAEAHNVKKVELLEIIFSEWQNRHPV